MTTALYECDERSLATRFRDGERGAVDEVIRRYSKLLHTISRMVLSDRDQADDAVQQAFLQAWRAAATLDPDRSLSAWLSTICRRVCIDRYRRDRRSRAAMTTTGEVEEQSVDGPSLDHAWTAAEVRQAICQLPAAEREVIHLAYLEGWSYPQIARRLDVPAGTVKSRAFRAQKRLARTLAHVAVAA